MPSSFRQPICAMPVWRSLLYVPVNVPRFVDKAHTRGADAIILDLEDSVPVAEKTTARTLVEAAAQSVARHGADVVVRINRPLDMAIRDIEACVLPDVNALQIAKVQSANHLQLIDEFIGELEQSRDLAHGHIRLIAMVETTDAFFSIDTIAKASARLVSVVLGGEDFALDAGFVPDPVVYQYPKQQALFASRAAGLTPLGLFGTVADYDDEENFKAMVRTSARFGMEGASCIHPKNVASLNAGFTPAIAEVEHAKRIVSEDAKYSAMGRGSFELDGKMIDIPVVQRAQKLIDRAEKIAAKDALHAAAVS